MLPAHKLDAFIAFAMLLIDLHSKIDNSKNERAMNFDNNE